LTSFELYSCFFSNGDGETKKNQNNMDLSRFVSLNQNELQVIFL
jgi:hypothetical protein